MTYREIFDDVVDIMKHDSATCIDIEGADPAPFREEIREDMTDKEFDISRFFKSLTPERPPKFHHERFIPASVMLTGIVLYLF